MSLGDTFNAASDDLADVAAGIDADADDSRREGRQVQSQGGEPEVYQEELDQERRSADDVDVGPGQEAQRGEGDDTEGADDDADGDADGDAEKGGLDGDGQSLEKHGEVGGEDGEVEVHRRGSFPISWPIWESMRWRN